MPSPTVNTAVRKVLTGVKRRAAKPTTQRTPLTFEILHDAGVVTRASGSLKDWRTFWRMNIRFYALLRWDEAAALRVQDFTFNEGFMDIRVARSKTDQMNKGSSVRVARQPAKPHACPVNITQIYIRMLRYPSSCNGLMQPRISQDPEGHKGDPETKLCYSRALADLKDLVSRTGRPGAEYGEHSGRRGGATAAAEAGAKWTDLKKLGRWSSDAAPQLYVENTVKRRSELPLMLAAAAQAEKPKSHPTIPPYVAQGGGGSPSPAQEASRHQEEHLSVVLPPVSATIGPAVSLP